MKKRTLLLNLSLILGTAYHALFLAAYLLQKPLFGSSLVPPDTLSELEAVYSIPVIVITAVCGAVFALLVLLMRKNASRRMLVDAIVLSGVMFIAERIASFFAVSDVELANRLIDEKGQLGVIAFSLNRSAVQFSDLFLLPLFAAAIVLMCCAACVKE